MDYQPEQQNFNQYEELNQVETVGNGMAIASMVCGIVGVVSSCCCTCLGILLGILAIVFAFVHKSKAGKFVGQAKAGLILGIIAIIIAIVNGTLGVLMSTGGNMDIYQQILDNM